MCRGAALAGQSEPVADLDALHGLDAHQRGRQAGIEPVLARRVGAETRQDAAGANLDDPPERVPVGARRVDRGLPALALAADLEHRARDLDPELPQQRLRDGSGGDVDGGVARARTLERVADVVMAVLEDAGEVGVAGPGQRHRLRPLPRRLALRRPRIHPPLPVLVIAVSHDERERCSERAPVPEAGEHLDLVLLELLARAAAVALLASVQIGVDRGAVEREPGRQAGQDRDERRPVRLAGGGESERHAASLACGSVARGKPGFPREPPARCRRRCASARSFGGTHRFPRIPSWPHEFLTRESVLRPA